jgi:hypothetical protein
MSEAQAPAGAGRVRHQRSVKNYLLDRHFQLKYTGLLLGVALLLSAGLGVVLWMTSSKVIEQSLRAVEQGRTTVKQGQETVERGKQVVVQSRRVSQVVAMNIAKEYKDDPELAKTFGDAAAQDEKKLADEQARLEREAEILKQRASELEQQAVEAEQRQRDLLLGLVIALAVLVLGVSVAGIVFTHKVAGPIYKMKRLLREVGEGKLVLREKLRKGDELQDFFEAFELMVADLRHHQESEIEKLDRILELLSEAPRSQRGMKELDDDGIELLKQLRREMQAQLEL